MQSPAFADPALMARITARALLEIGAVNFRADEPYTLTSGMKSPVYIDCRSLISFPRLRSTLMDFAVSTLYRDVGLEQFDAFAGGETAGIPFSAWIADRMELPMNYVRKKPKGFGRDAQIEGAPVAGKRVLLVEDLTTDGGSKFRFIDAIRAAEGECAHTFVLFFYDIFPQTRPAQCRWPFRATRKPHCASCLHRECTAALPTLRWLLCCFWMGVPFNLFGSEIMLPRLGTCALPRR